MLLTCENVSKRFGGMTAINGVSFDMKHGEILAIIGPNGAGKSVLFGLISGLYKPTSGKIKFKEDDITGMKSYLISQKGMARTFQLTALFDELRTVDNLAIGYQKRTKGGTGLWSTLFHSKGWQNDKTRMERKILETVVYIDLERKALEPVSALSQGEQRRLSIGIALMSDPQLILFDEPTAGLIQEDTDEITNLIRKVNRSGISICIIEHKMNMIMNLANRIVALSYGRKIAEGLPTEVAAHPEVIEAYLGRKRNA